MAPRLRLLTWDVKDTLLRLRLPVGEEYSAQAQAHGLKVEAAALESAFRQAYKAQKQKFPNYGLSQGLTSRQWWLNVVLQTFHLAGVQNSNILDPIANKLYEDFSSAKTWQMLEGAESTLQQCRERGLRLGVVSNFDRRLEDILAHCGLRKHFDFILTSEAAGWAKPDPRIFRQALQLADIAPTQAAHVGDNYLNDYQAPRDVGMHSFLLMGTKTQDPFPRTVPKEHILPSLPHLLAALNLLEGSDPKH
ncbi:haloacid dehalogenase-like hydrolase domain-containing protein 3 [Phascolarctos cinereus]|uniref:Haloacid dehalogenase-like hydrolase domain-containing protein 3 n=1 Tax=Phascolarctos cinereus TaxID=38626 RepID=A0A6P5IR18_PHACI|nr:haloacid dehalogenase-like hydrolase domain-containing protein 3 [Phascolarctos cinereus]XP_020821405.1 haloacid dehalogenase-like hydrolase domain-containing protein 3 [Phascolarctos cinereus]XP_020821406.1 haloacid dehalogenase-like hydrolase domain-containing protein 3 [Phascolarctos cinereus]XP_020821407.1 haloacid dehalogenase-like hydrolase domain-containing protein 3 [Phascolarctos cinereus]